MGDWNAPEYPVGVREESVTVTLLSLKASLVTGHH